MGSQKPAPFKHILKELLKNPSVGLWKGLACLLLVDTLVIFLPSNTPRQGGQRFSFSWCFVQVCFCRGRHSEPDCGLMMWWHLAPQLSGPLSSLQPGAWCGKGQETCGVLESALSHPVQQQRRPSVRTISSVFLGSSHSCWGGSCFRPSL